MQQDRLTQALYSNYQRAGRETKYWGSYFLRELKKYGGLAVAKRMLGKKSGNGDTKGFLALADAGRPDLSVESVVLSPEFRDLFSPDELATAERRLSRFPSDRQRKNVNPDTIYPDELPEGRSYREGAATRILVNRYERDPSARAACLAVKGTSCNVCDLRFEERYGDIGKGFIHVHHIKPLATTRGNYEIDPKRDLVPVCPNCHTMLHATDPPLSIEELKAKLKPC